MAALLSSCLYMFLSSQKAFLFYLDTTDAAATQIQPNWDQDCDSWCRSLPKQHFKNSISDSTGQFVTNCNVQLHFFSGSNKFVTGLYCISEVWTHHVKGRTEILLFHFSLQDIHMHIRTHCNETFGLHLLPPWLNYHLEKCNVICILYLF